MLKQEPKIVKRLPTARNKFHLLKRDAFSEKASDSHVTALLCFIFLMRSKSP